MTEHELLERAITLESAGPTSWRVCDRRLPRGEGRFLAFVEQKGDVFEVMQLADDFVWTTFESLPDALEHVALTNGDAEVARSAGALGWVR